MGNRVVADDRNGGGPKVMWKKYRKQVSLYCFNVSTVEKKTIRKYSQIFVLSKNAALVPGRRKLVDTRRKNASGFTAPFEVPTELWNRILHTPNAFTKVSVL